MGTKPPPLPVFLLNPKNEAFVNGLTNIPEDENPQYLIVAKVAAVFLAVAFSSYWLYKIYDAVQRGQTMAMKWAIMLVAGVVLFIVFVVYTTIGAIIVSRRYRRPCQLVHGELISCKNVGDETDDWECRYRFQSPVGHPMEGKWSTAGMITNVDDRKMPEPGTRVAIAYIDDRTHRMV